MASLQTQQSRQHFCGGTLIAKDIVVTAAHCVDNSIANAVTLPHIKIGGVTLDDDPDAEVGPQWGCLEVLLSRS